MSLISPAAPAYTISGSYTADGTARSQIAAALVMTGPQGSPVFSYNNLTNAPDSYTFSGTLTPGTYTYSALYSLDNSTEGVSPTAASGTGDIDFTLNDQFLDAANKTQSKTNQQTRQPLSQRAKAGTDNCVPNRISSRAANSAPWT